MADQAETMAAPSVQRLGLSQTKRYCAYPQLYTGTSLTGKPGDSLRNSERTPFAYALHEVYSPLSTTSPETHVLYPNLLQERQAISMEVLQCRRTDQAMLTNSMRQATGAAYGEGEIQTEVGGGHKMTSGL
jgi:hypothetical protein